MRERKCPDNIGVGRLWRAKCLIPLICFPNRRMTTEMDFFPLFVSPTSEWSAKRMFSFIFSVASNGDSDSHHLGVEIKLKWLGKVMWKNRKHRSKWHKESAKCCLSLWEGGRTVDIYRVRKRKFGIFVVYLQKCAMFFFLSLQNHDSWILFYLLFLICHFHRSEETEILEFPINIISLCCQKKK